MKKAKWIFPALMLLIVAVLVAINKSAIAAAFKPKDKAPDGTDGSSTEPGKPAAGSAVSTTITSGALDITRTLKSGVNGPEVAQLQTLLNANRPDLVKAATKDKQLLVVDGSFGENTELATFAVLGTKVTNLTSAFVMLQAMTGGVKSK